MVKKDEGAVIKPLEEYPDIEFVTSGVKQIDELVGGIPVGRITEVYAKKGVGKSTLTTMMAAALSKDHKVLVIDAENAIDTRRLKEFGVNFDNVDFSTCSVLEEIGQLILDGLGNYKASILDSIAGTITNTEATSQIGDHNVGNKGKVMNSIFSRRLPEQLGNSQCALVLINQLRDSFNLYTDKTYTPGGRAVEYAASLRLELNTYAADRIMDGKQQVGHWVNVKVTKSKVSKPFIHTKFKLIY